MDLTEEVREFANDMSRRVEENMTKAQRRVERRLAERKAKAMLRQRAQETVEAIDAFTGEMGEREKLLGRAGTLIKARDRLSAALEGVENDG